MPKLKMRRRTTAILIVFLFLLTFIGYGMFVEPFKISISHFSFDVEGFSNLSIKIVLIGDMHVGNRREMKFLSKVVNKINYYQPDIILLAGDFINYYEEEIQFLGPLKNLTAKYGVYAVLGNHDYGYGYRNKELANKVEAKLENMNINVLRNENVLIEINKTQFYIIGLDSILAGECNLTQATINVKEDIPKILLCHNPDVVFINGTENFDLILSGHTHGGAINLPLIGPVFKVTKLERKYYHGFHEINGRKIYVTRGIGSRVLYFFNFRFNAPPEIVVIELY